MIVAEQREGALRKISLELASTARKLADQSGDEVSALLLGSGVEKLGAELGKYGVDKVFVGDKLICTRPMYAGKCFGEVAFNASPAMASLRPNVFPAAENAKAGAVTK